MATTQTINLKKMRDSLLEIYTDLLKCSQKKTKKLKQLIKTLIKDGKL